jgi:hypothetical protein
MGYIYVMLDSRNKQLLFEHSNIFWDVTSVSTGNLLPCTTLVIVTETQFPLCEGRTQYVNKGYKRFSRKNVSKILQANVFRCGRHLDYSHVTHSWRYNFNGYGIRDFS